MNTVSLVCFEVNDMSMPKGYCKTEKRERNVALYRDYMAGMKLKDISQKYHVSEGRACDIIKYTTELIRMGIIKEV